MKHLAEVDERSQLELRIHPEDPPLVDPRPELRRREEPILVDEASGAEATESVMSPDLILLEERYVVRSLDVVGARMHGEHEALAEGNELARLGAVLDER